MTASGPHVPQAIWMQLELRGILTLRLHDPLPAFYSSGSSSSRIGQSAGIPDETSLLPLRTPENPCQAHTPSRSAWSFTREASRLFPCILHAVLLSALQRHASPVCGFFRKFPEANALPDACNAMQALSLLFSQLCYRQFQCLSLSDAAFDHCVEHHLRMNIPWGDRMFSVQTCSFSLPKIARPYSMCNRDFPWGESIGTT